MDMKTNTKNKTLSQNLEKYSSTVWQLAYRGWLRRSRLWKLATWRLECRGPTGVVPPWLPVPFPFSISSLLVAAQWATAGDAPCPHQLGSWRCTGQIQEGVNPAHLAVAARCPASSLGDGEQRGLWRHVPDLDAPVKRDGSHPLAVGVKAAGGERHHVMIWGTGKVTWYHAFRTLGHMPLGHWGCSPRQRQ